MKKYSLKNHINKRRDYLKKKLAIIHTTPVTINIMKELAAQYLPDVQINNYLDDSILPQLKESNGDINTVKDRIIQFVKNAEMIHANAVLFACSSIGEVAERAQELVHIPVIRIDDAMTETAVKAGGKIGVAATLPTTLNPTFNLLADKADKLQTDIELISLLCEDAYLELMNGNKEKHDQILAENLKELGGQTDVVVLAQASMASAVTALPSEIQSKFLTSPELGMKQMRSILNESSREGD